MRRKHYLKRTAALLLAVLLMGQSLSVSAEEPQSEETTLSSSEQSVISDETGEDETASSTQSGSNPGTTQNDTNTDAPVSDGTTVQEPESEQDKETADQNSSGSGEDFVPEEETEVPEEETSAEEQETVSPEEEAEVEATAENADKASYILQYRTHSQTVGWQDWVNGGEQAGTTGQSKRLEAIYIRVLQVNGTSGASEQTPVSDAIEYRAHLKDVGWQDWVSGGQLAGTTGESRRIEAIQIRLTGELAQKYDIYYQVHCSSFGDMGWAKNGEKAGTEGYAKAMEAITIRLVEKGSSDAPAQTERSFISPTEKGTLTYTSHVQDYGWMDSVADGAVSGTQGESKRMEAIRIYLANPTDSSGKTIEGAVQYRAHSQTYGWMDWVNEGELAGTSGESKRMEAIQIRLTGAIADQYDIYYRVHSSAWGTLGWAKNGETAGTVGYYRSIESIEIRLVAKGSTEAPQQTGRSYLSTDRIGKLSFSANLRNEGWQSSKGNNDVAGTIGESKTIDALKMSITSGTEGSSSTLYSGSIVYKVYMQDLGWSESFTNGETAGVTGKRIEAVQISLTGELAEYCDVYYSTHIQKYGWLGWAKNGQTAGSTDIGYRMEALQVYIIPKTASAPGMTTGYYTNEPFRTRYEDAINTIINEAGWDLYSCFSWIVNNFSYQTLPIPMDPPEGYTREEGYAIYGVENRRGNCYCFAAAFAGVAKKLGYEAYFIEGRVGMRGGGTGPHGWVEVVIDGTTYVCDPDGQYELGGNFYMVSYGSARLTYYK